MLASWPVAAAGWRVGVVRPPMVVAIASTPQRGIQGGGEVRAQENKIKKFGKENTRVREEKLPMLQSFSNTWV